MKKLRFRKNQIIITALAIMIAVAGYVRYADKNLDSRTEGTSAAAGEEAAVDDTELIDLESLDTDITDMDTATADNSSSQGNGDETAGAEQSAGAD